MQRQLSGLRRASLLGTLLVSASSLAFGHYHWSYLAQRSGSSTDMPLKYDLNALPNNTVSFFIAKSGPTKLVDDDNFTSLISQIRRAAESWNAVPTSALRVKFGGLVDFPDTQPAAADLVDNHITPSIEVFFDDEMPPGILALSWPQTRDDLTYLTADSTPDKPNPGFAPLLKSRLQLRSDLSVTQQASYSDDFFLTIVHEFGHNLGLQHSTSSAAMSTSITRGTNKAMPLSADDVAGISYLYPADGYAASVGSISGKITVAGTQNPANLASVVALSADGTAINAMTGPDGRYEIDGLPPGEYRLYAHPLPPTQLGESLPAGIVPQTVVDGETPAMPFTATLGFDTQFFPGTREWTEAAKIVVTAAKTVVDVNLDLPRNTSANSVYNLRMFAFYTDAQVPAHAPPLVTGSRQWLAFTAPGTLVSGTHNLAPGLRLSVIGGPADVEQNTVQYWTDSNGVSFLLVVGDANDVKAATPVSVAVNSDAGLYVLPLAFSVVPTAHPFISKISDSGDGPGSVRVEGSNLTATTNILFDGADALSVLANDDGSLTVKAPPAQGTQMSVVEAMSMNGQTSLQPVGALPLPVYTYASADNPSVVSTVGNVTAGTDTMVRIDGINTSFLASRIASGQTVVGFGSTEIVVKQLWVVSDSQLLMNIGITPAAKAGPVTMTIATGLQLVTLANALQVHPADQSMTMQAPILNSITGLSGAPVGTSVVIHVIGIPDDFTGWKMTMGGVFTNVTRISSTELHADVPQLDPGVVPVKLIPPFGVIPQVLFQVDSAPPLILMITPDKGGISNNFPLAKLDSQVAIEVVNLTGTLDTPSPDLVQVRVGNVAFVPDEVVRTGETTFRVSFTLTSALAATGQQDLTVGIGTRVSAARTLVIAAPVVATP